METGKRNDAVDGNEPSTSANDIVPAEQGDSLANGPSVGQNAGSQIRLDATLSNLQSVCYIYRQDIVRSKTDGKIGIVMEVAGDSDSDSSESDDEDEEDDEEDEEVGSNGKDDTENDEDDDGNADRSRDGGGEKTGPLPADQVRVLWMDESETTQSISEVQVIDRGFLHGDYVAAASDPTGQVGIVVDVDISVDLLSTDGSVKNDISSRDLRRVRDFTVGDYVVHGPWLGRVDDVLDNVTVLFDDGSVCKVIKADPLRLSPVGKSFIEDVHFPYYPGQRVKASSSSVLKNSRWLSGLWKANRLEGTVMKVTVGSVFVYWLASVGYGPGCGNSPPQEQSPKNLKLLSCLSHANWQLGDWCLLPLPLLSSSISLDNGFSRLELQDSTKEELESPPTGEECDPEAVTSLETTDNSEINSEGLLDKSAEKIGSNVPVASSSSCSSPSISKEPAHETWPLHRKKIRKVFIRRDKRGRKKEENFEKALLIVNTKTKVDVAWQDGKIECGVESKNLIPIDSPGDHEFLAEQYVVEKAVDDDDDAGEVRRVGVVKSVNAKERTACVKWLKPVSRVEDPREFDKEEVVSVYELEGHPDYDYCYGDVVVRLSPASVPAERDSSASTVEKSETKVQPDEQKGEGCKSAEDTDVDDAFAEFSDLSWVGNITGLRNGDIEVTWADGMVSMVGPQAIYVVGREDDGSIAAGSEVSDDAASWETVDDDEMENLVKEGIDTRSATDISVETEESTTGMENSGTNGALSIPLAAFGFMTRLASGIFSRGRKNTDSSSPNSRSDDELQPEESDARQDPSDDSGSHKSDGSANSGILTTSGKLQAIDAANGTNLSELAETLCSLKQEEANAPARFDNDAYGFKGFDITKEPYDHHFYGSIGQSSGRKWLKKVQRDWNILQNNLPEGIYVRAYEDRMDLLRAVIIGAYGTPYQDGLFFFDFHLPPEYPDVPPSAHYHSGGWRINPNLYEEGKVCLSLLNTWSGRGNEVWDPSSSSILQVLVSLQGLVLNAKPYFNEAGYDKQIGTAEGEKNSLSYNENTFLLNCKTMMHLMRRPPKGFEELVREHFRRRGYYILRACDAYMKGCLIGSLSKDAYISSNSNGDSNSVGFKLMLAKIVPKLFSALYEIGADCREFKHLQQSQECL